MSIVHIVLFKLKSNLSDTEVTACLHPSSNKPYIVTSSGGKDNSPEGAQGGFTHGFVVEFASAEDRDYYVSKDPAHQEFVKNFRSKFDDVRVVDYTKGVY